MQVFFRKFMHRYFADEQAVILFFLILGIGFLIIGMGTMLVPLFAAVILAFLMQGAIDFLVRLKAPRNIAMISVYTACLSITASLLVIMLPMLWHQLTGLLGDVPAMLAKGQQALMKLPRQYPRLVSYQDVNGWIDGIQVQLGHFGQWLVAVSWNLIPNLITYSIYLVLVPILIFFMLKDQDQLRGWFSARLPSHHPALSRIGNEINRQLYNYIRGKMIEVVVVTIATYIAFWWFDLNYALLLAIGVGLSVIIPYVGAILVTIPVVFIAFFQWGGMSEDFWWVLGVHVAIQVLDGNLLVPVLFAEAVNLHPVAIITAVVIFGGMWGVWGVFFAIPLAVVIRAVLENWPRTEVADSSR